MSETIETVNFEPGKKHYMSWPVIALIDFVTIISFENIFYPFQNQGLSVVVSWIFLLFAYVIPYALMSSQMGLTFNLQAAQYYETSCLAFTRAKHVFVYN